MNNPSDTMILILGEIKGTVAEVKEAIRELKETVANNNNSHKDKIDRVEKHHHDRLTKLEIMKERAIAYMLGISAAIGAVFHFIPKALAAIVGGH